ncbi:Hypothetical_protein [Hexamita inflata]|uniref:Hypothetical_protein n=1 Tax=Hexamita inflata TaxID=28002 RepID=A0AA86TWY2_9EUKA|nr:Hypothetical protein HINF_LOCUS20010 [Hexamita inflata]
MLDASQTSRARAQTRISSSAHCKKKTPKQSSHSLTETRPISPFAIKKEEQKPCRRKLKKKDTKWANAEETHKEEPSSSKRNSPKKISHKSPNETELYNIISYIKLQAIYMASSLRKKYNDSYFITNKMRINMILLITQYSLLHDKLFWNVLVRKVGNFGQYFKFLCGKTNIYAE